MNKNTLKVYGNLAVAKLKKNSPKILVGVGIASGIAAIAYAKSALVAYCSAPNVLYPVGNTYPLSTHA